MATFYLISYTPLVASKAGRAASERHGIPPLVDGSIRREPDLEIERPAITCLCRADKFVPRLRPNDVVAYVLCKKRYGQRRPQRRLTAILRVSDVLPSHLDGARWYRVNKFPLPNNCWVRGNPAKPLDHSHQLHRLSKMLSDSQIHREWDVVYRARAMQHGTFVICEKLFHDLEWTAPEVTEPQLMQVFGRVPGTQNPGAWDIAHAQHLFSLLKIDVRLSGI